MPTRRQILATGLTLVPATGATVAMAQLAGAGLPRVGLLLAESVSLQATRVAAFRAGLMDLGLIDGRTIRIEMRSAEGHYDRLAALAAELVAARVDVIVAFGIKALTAAWSATRSIPIVIPATSSDLVAMGYAKTLARPGGNVTGSTSFGPEIMAKRLELLKELQKPVARVGVLVNPANSSFGPARAEMDAAARQMKVTLVHQAVKATSEFPTAVAALARAGVQAIVVQDDTLFNEVNSREIAALSSQQGWPSIGSVGLAEAGGTIGYGRSNDLYRQGARFVEAILRGSKPADMPIEQASRFELVINMNSVRALGIRVPPSIAARADRTIG